MQASLADIGLLSIRQRLVEKRVHMRDAFPRQLEGDKPHHHPNQNVDNALSFRRTQSRRKPGRQ
ncbi:hypothetical protein LTSERUB_4866 [Salmonella enterica subsp. enterica serovar Rubislaw str. A4-653]|uniref:Uncharacterized protein n=1 Tax=Salmonella enterica subsp. enterica serovar Rubislaw str. A4-653 TaxID=913081 RepID=G5QPC1_SALRU|nr:hypothetical protein LTSERUB_4866 [Salmonella enterica subsp. enterica serovar Rubislaw str. A4-653]